MRLQSMIKSNNTVYDIISEIYNEPEKDISIKYPQIINFNDINKQKKINDIIKNQVFNIVKAYKTKDIELVVLEIDYKIKLKNENLLSIQFEGYVNFKNSFHPYHLFFTTNINIIKAKKIELSEVINVNNEFIELFRKGKMKAVSLIYKDGYLDENTNLELIEIFDLGNFYLTKDSLGISVEVIYVIGSHAEFEIKYTDILDNIKLKNEIWKYLAK